MPLIALTGYDAWGILREQRRATYSIDRIFPWGQSEQRFAGVRELNIIDLHFHDLRHEATSRLFEALRR